MSGESAILLAHVRQDATGQPLPHPLDEHLRGVAALAESFAAAFGAGDWAKLAGLWHDLGKYGAAFQRRVRSVSGYDAHIETAPGRVDHSTAGALHAMARMKGVGRVLAYLIAGHHAGLPDWLSAEKPASSLAQRLKQADLLTEALAQSPPADILDAPSPTSNPGQRDCTLWSWTSVRRNEVAGVISVDNVKTATNRGKGALGLYADEDRQQQAALLLREVDYLIHARFELTDRAGPDDTLAEYAAMFRRRAEKGQCFNQPYLGCREFSAAFAWVDPAGSWPESIADSRDLGWMLYDLEYRSSEPTPCFFRAQLDNGTVRVPAWNSEEIVR